MKRRSQSSTFTPFREHQAGVARSVVGCAVTLLVLEDHTGLHNSILRLYVAGERLKVIVEGLGEDRQGWGGWLICRNEAAAELRLVCSALCVESMEAAA